MQLPTFFKIFVFATLHCLVAGSPLEQRATTAARTSTPSGCLTVRGSGTQTGEYKTLSSALSSLGSSTSSACIFVYPGNYTGQTTINYGGPLTIYGYTTSAKEVSSNVVTFSNKISSAAAGSNDASSTIQVKGSYVKIYNINVENTYGPGAQAVVVTANGNYLSFYACKFSGYQDTLYVKSGNQYFTHCYIEGAVDYIFGAANVWIGASTMASNGNGAITASSRETNDSTWYVFDSSTITAAPGYTTTGGVYLGRPWRVLARVMYQNSNLGSVVNAAGWTTMAEGATPIYEEFNNTGAGSSTAKRLYETKATAAVTLSQMFPGSYCNWIDCTV